MTDFVSRLVARYVQWRLIQGLLKRKRSTVAWALDHGARLDGWVVLGPAHYEHLSIHAPSLAHRFPCAGAIELAVEACCDEDILRLLLERGARIPDSMAGRANPDFWERLECRMKRVRGVNHAPKLRQAYAGWMASEHERQVLEQVCPMAMGQRRAARI